MYNQNGIKNHHHHHLHHQNNNNNNNNNSNNEHDDASDTDHIDYTDLHHETIKFNNRNNHKLAMAMRQTNGNADDTIYDGSVKTATSDDPIATNGGNGDGEQFAYKTLNGDVIRSVVPPGKGKSINYKVSNRLSLMFMFTFV